MKLDGCFRTFLRDLYVALFVRDGKKRMCSTGVTGTAALGRAEALRAVILDPPLKRWAKGNRDLAALGR
jgi:hypothetical protein